ncbi:MAG: hypothetical protein H0S85_02740 [Desulfovibrionaceae bacterium]|jgi:hypothetical protein|nr:hypothetical protein [Desulfovibrionaceae bacterium]
MPSPRPFRPLPAARGPRGASSHAPVRPLITVAAWCIVAALAAALPGAGAALAADKNPTPRQDTFVGNFHEGIVIEREPETGDEVMKAGPEPQAEEQGNGSAPPVSVTPEIRLPAHRGK